MITYADLPAWNVADRATVRMACRIIGTKLGHILECSEYLAFHHVFGEQHFRFGNPTLPDGTICDAYSTGDTVIVRPGHVRKPLMVHELGHTFDRRYQLRPSRDLWDANIDRPAYIFPANGHLWPGMHPPSLGDYDPQETWANLFADYMLDMLAQNSTGAKLAGWMDEKMDEWLGRDECRVTTTGTA